LESNAGSSAEPYHRRDIPSNTLRASCGGVGLAVHARALGVLAGAVRLRVGADLLQLPLVINFGRRGLLLLRGDGGFDGGEMLLGG